MGCREATMKTGAELIAEERQRQLDDEGWTAEETLGTRTAS